MQLIEAIEILREKINEEFSTDTAEAFCMAISALEKQEVKKTVDSRCPNCESDTVEVWQDGGYVPTKFSFCPDCGQKILWEE